MSDNAHDQAPPTPHTGPIKNPRQLLLTVLFAFLTPILIITGLAYYVVSADKPSGVATGANMALYGVTAEDREHEVVKRLAKVGSVEVRDANRPLATGEAVFKAQCAACHATGAAGAPKFGDKAAWGPRITQGYDTLLQHALKGKGAMPPQGGGDFDDIEIGRAVVYMADDAGAKFPVPEKPAGAAATEAAAPAAAPAAPAVAAAAPTAAPAAAAAPAATKTAAAAPGAGEALYKQVCFACHAAGVAGAPKFGDKDAWAPRIKLGLDQLTAAAIKGIGAMPPRGGSQASDADMHAAVQYMVDAAK